MAAEAYRLTSGIAPGGWPVAKQLVRAATSIPLNIAEGAGEFSALDKARFYRYARRSAAETSAAFDVMSAAGHLEASAVAKVRQSLDEIGAMLTILIRAQLDRAQSAAVERRGRRERSSSPTSGPRTDQSATAMPPHRAQQSATAMPPHRTQQPPTGNASRRRAPAATGPAAPHDDPSATGPAAPHDDPSATGNLP